MTVTAHASSLTDTATCMLDEVRLALHECLSGLTDEQIWSHPADGRHSIGTITEHVLYALDVYCGELQTGRTACPHEEAFSVYGMTVEEVEAGISRHFSGDEFSERVDAVCNAAAGGITGTLDRELRRLVRAEEMSPEADRNRLEYFLSGIFHANEHIRQIWLLRGAMGLAVKGEHQWPSWLYW